MTHIPSPDNLIKRRRAKELGIAPARRRDIKSLRGLRFTRLRVLALCPIELNGCLGASWICRCDCGAITLARTDKLTSGHKKSCGCLRSEQSARNIRHAIEARWHHHGPQ